MCFLWCHIKPELVCLRQSRCSAMLHESVDIPAAGNRMDSHTNEMLKRQVLLYDLYVYQLLTLLPDKICSTGQSCNTPNYDDNILKIVNNSTCTWQAYEYENHHLCCAVRLENKCSVSWVVGNVSTEENDLPTITPVGNAGILENVFFTISIEKS